MSEKLIMIMGSMGSGKSTAAEMLCGYGFKEDMFAAPLKEFAMLLGFTEQQVYGTQAEKLQVNKFWGISGREFLQKFGSDVCRNSLASKIPNMKMNDRTIWARVVEQKITKYPLLVMSDGRFPDEAKLVKDNGGIIIRIIRDVDGDVDGNGEHKPNEHTNEHKTHVSEMSMSSIQEDYLIENNGTLDDLKKSLDYILKAEGLNLEWYLDKIDREEKETLWGTMIVLGILSMMVIMFQWMTNM